jgi:thiol-disulfide isomerase/thioredoxin
MASKAKSRYQTAPSKPFSRRVTVGLVLVGLIAVVLFIIAVHPGASNTPLSAPASVSGNAAGAAASMTLPTIDGQTIALPGNPGQITVLYTMGYWCSTCIPGAKALAQLQPDYARRGVRFVAVDLTPEVKPSDLPPFLQAVGNNQLTWAMDSSGRFAYLYQINSLDTAIILDGQGREVYRNHQGASDAELRAALDKLLAS